MRVALVFLFALSIVASAASAQNQRERAVRDDKQNLASDQSWIYDDLDAALAAAKEADKPIMVLIRCLP